MTSKKSGDSVAKKMTEKSDEKAKTKVSSKLSNSKIAYGAIAVVLVVGFGSGFAAGYLSKDIGSEQSQRNSLEGDFGPGGGMGGRGMMGDGMRGGILGEVTDITESAITVEDRMSGDENTYKITEETEINDQDNDSANLSDISKGDTVMVRIDSESSDEAASILLNPTFSAPGRGVSDQSNDSESSSV